MRAFDEPVHDRLDFDIFMAVSDSAGLFISPSPGYNLCATQPCRQGCVGRLLRSDRTSHVIAGLVQAWWRRDRVVLKVLNNLLVIFNSWQSLTNLARNLIVSSTKGSASLEAS
jgi:hypothetical protein